MTLKNQPHTI